MVVASGIVDELLKWTAVLTAAGTAATGLAAVIGLFTVVVPIARNRHDETRLLLERRRISYRNLNITHEIVLTHGAAPDGEVPDPQRAISISTPMSGLSQFLIFRLNIRNIGDGPVDIWACLTAARELNVVHHREAWGGNIEWEDLDPYYFDTPLPQGGKLAGISNTRHIVYSQDDYLQFDPKEEDTLTRIDRIDEVESDLTLLYRAFLVGRGYANEQPSLDERPKRDVFARQQLQQAIFNISGPSFRILLGEDDPLNWVADRDGWQCFMLYHSAFTEDKRDEIGWTHIDWLNNDLEGEWGRTHSEQEAKARCEQELAAEKTHWKRHWEVFKQAVAKCKMAKNGFADLYKTNWKPNTENLPVGRGTDLTTLRVQQLFAKLSPFLQWKPEDEESMPIWEKFFVVTIKPKRDGRLIAPDGVHVHDNEASA